MHWFGDHDSLTGYLVPYTKVRELPLLNEAVLGTTFLHKLELFSEIFLVQVRFKCV